LARQTNIKLRRSATAGAIPTTSNLDLGELALNTNDGKLYMKTTEGSLDSVIQVGTATDSYFKIRKSVTQTLTVTVASKTSDHAYTGTGSSSGYVINGIESPHLVLVPGNTYKFDQSDSSNSGHPLRFYYEADKTTAYTTGVTTSGTPGSSGAHTTIVPTSTTPVALYYQCSAHGYMGNVASFNTRNLTGFDTDDLSVGSTNLYFTNALARAAISAGTGISYNSSTGVISNSQTQYNNSDARSAISVNDAGGDGSLGYNSTTGVITYTGPSAAEVQAHISAGTGVGISNGQISIGQAVATTSNVQFNDLQVDGNATVTGNTTITGNLTVNGTQTTLNTATLDVEDINITVASGATTSAATNNAGLTFGAWSSGTIPTLKWIHSNNRFSFNKALAAQGFVGNLTGNADTATALATARNISGVSFDGTADITLNTSGITENTNLYYTNARADARIAAASIDDLSDVDTTTSAPSSGEILKWDGSNWVPGTDLSGAANQNLFETIAVSGQSDIVADGVSDTLTFAAGSGIQLTTNASTDTLTITSTATGSVTEAFKTIAVSGQSNVVADTATDTLTLVAGSNMTITTNASGDSITFASSGSGGGGSAASADIRKVFKYTTTGSTTAFSGSDDNSNTLSYTLGAADVYLNGIKQELTTDYAETNTSTITFVNAIASGNVVEIIAYYRTIGTGNSVVNQYTGDGSTDAFTLTTAPVSENNLLVYIDGVYQQKTDYTTSGTTLTMDTAPASGAIIETVAMVGAITAQQDLTLTGELDVVTLDVSGNGDIDGNLLVGGNLHLDGNNQELRFYEGSNYVGFEAPALSGDQIWVLPDSDGTAGYALKTDGSGNLSWGLAGDNAFKTIAVSGQSDVVADSTADTLTLAAGAGIALTTNASTDTITITNNQLGANAFGNIAVSGQTTVAADSTNDTLTIESGAGIVLTTDATNDKLIISGGSGSVFTTDFFTASGSGSALLTYTLTETPSSEDELICFIEGVYQNKNSYTLTGNSLVFDSGIVAGQEVVVHHIGAGVVGTTPTIHTETGNGSAYSYTLPFTPPNENYLQVFWDGVYQNHDQYTVSGTTLDFGSSNVPPSGTAIEVVIPSVNGIGTPSDGTVTPAKLSTGGPSWDGNSNFIVGSSYIRSDSTSVSSTSATTVATHAIATYRTVKYQVQITQGAHIHSTELNAIHDGTTVYLTEYGTIFTGSSLATFDATITSGNMLLQVTMGSASSSTIKVISSAISV
tara:strand:+ start:254 stop:3961 length:3708 start_codon:yes stop_codon:yes gene_type:complete